MTNIVIMGWQLKTGLLIAGAVVSAASYGYGYLTGSGKTVKVALETLRPKK